MELRDHAREVLRAFCEETGQQRSPKSKQMVQSVGEPRNAAANHGVSAAQRFFCLMQLVGEFHALKASVLGLWSRANVSGAAEPAAEEIARCNEALDQALAHLVERCSIELAKSRDMFLTVLGDRERTRTERDAMSASTTETASRSARLPSACFGQLERDLPVDDMPLIIAIFADASSATIATEQLVAFGIPASRVHLHQKGTPPKNATGIIVDEYFTGGFLTNFVRLLGGLLNTKTDPDDATSYQDAIQHEGVAVSAQVEKALTDQVEALLRSSGALKVTGQSV